MASEGQGQVKSSGTAGLYWSGQRITGLVTLYENWILNRSHPPTPALPPPFPPSRAACRFAATSLIVRWSTHSGNSNNSNSGNSGNSGNTDTQSHIWRYKVAAWPNQIRKLTHFHHIFWHLTFRIRRGPLVSSAPLPPLSSPGHDMNALRPWAPLVGISHVACWAACLAACLHACHDEGWPYDPSASLWLQLGLQLELQKVTEPAIKCDAHAYNIAPKRTPRWCGRQSLLTNENLQITLFHFHFVDFLPNCWQMQHFVAATAAAAALVNFRQWHFMRLLKIIVMRIAAKQCQWHV